MRPVVAFGKARLYQGNCLDLLAAWPHNSVHAVVTDPPYGLVEYSAHEHEKLRNRNGGVWRLPPAFDGHQRSPVPRFTTLGRGQIDELGQFFRDWALRLHPVLVPGAHVVLASNQLLSFMVSNALYRAGFEPRGILVRLVQTLRGGDRPKGAHAEFAEVTVIPRSMWEPWLLFRKPLEGRVQDNLRKWRTGALRRPTPERPFGDVIRSTRTPRVERELAPHPSLKPQAFLRYMIRTALPLGEGVVLDPFAGVGSTLAAAQAEGMASIGVELFPEYCQLAKSAIPALAALPANN